MIQFDSRDFTDPVAGAGILVFYATATYPAIQLAGFGFGPDWGISVFLLISIVGGAVGGALMLRRFRLLGISCGALTGPVILLVCFLAAQADAGMNARLNLKAMVLAPIFFLLPMILLHRAIDAAVQKRSGRMAKSAKRR
jgi:hypothetical protein